MFKVLGDNTRYAIFLELARSARPLSTAEIADVLGLHANTVRPHLDRMRELGLVDMSTSSRGEVGRPQHRFTLAADAPSLGLEPPTTPVLARMFVTMADRLGATDGDAEAIGEVEGVARAARRREASTLEALVADLDQLGFDPIVAEGVDEDSAVVAFGNCPFHAFVDQHPELVCGLHRGLVNGFVESFGDAEVHEFCTLASSTPCQVTVTNR